MAGKTRRSKKKPGAARPEGPRAPPQLPLDIIYNIGLQLTLDPRHSLQTLHGPCFLPTNHNKDLRALTYTSRANRDLLEPLLYRHVVLMKPQEVCSFFSTIAAAPRLRQHVQHFGCVARLNGPQVRKDALPQCRAFWQKHHGSQRSSIITLLSGLGLSNLAWAASLWERRKDRFVFNADFRHDAVLELLFVSTLLLLTNVQTFVWKDLDGRPVAPLLTYLFDAALMTGSQLMPKLKVLNTWKETLAVDERAQFFIYKTHLWENLETLYLNAVDLDNEFTDMVVKGDFKKNLPVKRLYIHCPSGAEHLFHPGMYHPEHPLLSNSALDADNPDNDKSKFKAFRNLEFLEINFTWFETRAVEGSRALKSLLHAVGAPERLNLTGHPLPMKALSTGVIHSRLKYLKVKELIRNAPSSVRSKDTLITRLNNLWDAEDWKRLVPNLCEIDWDHYKFRRKDLEGEDKAVWTLEDEEEWEDDDNDELDIDDLFGYGYGPYDGLDGLDGLDDDDDDDGDLAVDFGPDFAGDPIAALVALQNAGYPMEVEALINQLALHFHPPGSE
ncbi:hypothetical protein NW759_001952 [Fusarium solani]|nr:hypothetical protein NW759_001952 [Fusarium solani]